MGLRKEGLNKGGWASNPPELPDRARTESQPLLSGSHFCSNPVTFRDCQGLFRDAKSISCPALSHTAL